MCALAAVALYAVFSLGRDYGAGSAILALKERAKQTTDGRDASALHAAAAEMPRMLKH